MLWEIMQRRNGRFCLENQRTQDTTDETWATAAEAESAAVEYNARAAQIAADMAARSQAAEARRAAIAIPTEMLTNGNDR